MSHDTEFPKDSKPVVLSDDREQVIDDWGRRAGAALRSAAPDDGLSAIMRRARNQRIVRVGGVVAGVVAVLAVGIAVLGREDQSSPQPVNDTVPPTDVVSDGPIYSTKTFNVPFDVTLPTWLPAEPSDEQPNFTTWKATNADRAVRFLIPVNVYPPGGADGAIPPPKDYLAYLLSQTEYGAHFTDMTKTTVGGRPATILTATVDYEDTDGSLGCPLEDMAPLDCFGLQPDLVLRLAVVDTGDKTLLIWLRNKTSNTTSEIDSFEKMLTSLRFSDRAVQTTAPPPATTPLVATPLDGTYQWTITKTDTLGNGTASDKQPDNLALFPATFTASMDRGTWNLRDHDGSGDSAKGSGTYTVVGNEVMLTWQTNGVTETFNYTVDNDGTLHLNPAYPMNPGDRFVLATRPWEKIG